MTVKSILVPVDFSEISQKVVKTAIRLAVGMKMQITLLHVQNGNKHGNPYALLKELSFLANELQDKPVFELMVKAGNVFHTISDESRNEKYGLMVAGSHGFKGLRERILGTDILKLLKGISVPALVVQQDFTLPQEAFKKILFPAGSHQAFDHQISATGAIAKAFGAEVHLYMVEKTGLSFSDELINNIRKAENSFLQLGISYRKVVEVQDVYSIGFAKQIMAYAEKESMDMISIMASSSRELHYIADADKVSILTNAAAIPVLSGNDKIKS